MDQRIQTAKRDADLVRGLNLLRQSDQLTVCSIKELGATAFDLAELQGMKLPQDGWAEQLAALYNHAFPLGMGYLHADMKHVMSVDEAMIVLMLFGTQFDYLQGRLIKVNVASPESWLYDRDNGENAFLNALTCPGCARCAC